MQSVSRSHRELQSVMAELLWRRREVVSVVSSDVGTNAAALAPPLVAVSSQTGETNNQTLKWWGLTSLTFAAFQLGIQCFDDHIVVFFVLFCFFKITWLGCSEAWRPTPGHRRYHNAVGCRRNKTLRRRRDREAQSHSVGPANKAMNIRCEQKW